MTGTGITEMKLNITGKILLFKSLSLVSDEVLSDFRKMPDSLTFAQAVETSRPSRTNWRMPIIRPTLQQ